MHIADVLHGIASLLWPLLVAVGLWYFRLEIKLLFGAMPDALKRIHSAEALGVRVEMREAESAVIAGTAQAVIDIPSTSSLPAVDSSNISAASTTSNDRRLSVMQIATQIDQEVRILAAANGGKDLRRPSSLLLAEVVKHYDLPASILQSQLAFNDLRNTVAHNWERADPNDEVLQSGETILQILRAVPRARTEVIGAQIPLYSDPECTLKLRDAWVVALKNYAANNVPSPPVFYPTTREYRVGALVTYEWNMQRTFGILYYGSPFDGDEIRCSWSSSAEFIGQQIS